MSFVINIFRDHNISYVTSGKNVTKNSIGIPCPFCGDDPSQHLNIAISGEKEGQWHCWRSEDHRGRTLEFLLARLLAKSRQEVRVLLAQYQQHPNLSKAGNTFDSFDTINTKELWNKKTPPIVQTKWLDIDKQFSESFTVLTRLNTVTSLAWEYLLSRGFDHIDELGRYYDLAFSATGEWGYRIIIPVYFRGRMGDVDRKEYKAQSLPTLPQPLHRRFANTHS